jgi:hypothetical protein
VRVEQLEDKRGRLDGRHKGSKGKESGWDRLSAVQLAIVRMNLQLSARAVLFSLSRFASLRHRRTNPPRRADNEFPLLFPPFVFLSSHTLKPWTSLGVS